MSNRDVTIEQISALIDNELSDEESRELRQRIDADPQLQELYQQLHSTTSLFSSLPQLAPPPGLSASINRRIRHPHSGFFNRLRGYIENMQVKVPVFPAYTAAAVSVLIIAIAIYFTLANPDQNDQAMFAAADQPQNEPKTEGVDMEMQGGTGAVPAAEPEDEASPRLESQELADFRVDDMTAEEDVASPGMRIEQPLEPEPSRREARSYAAGSPRLERAGGPMYRAEIIETYYQQGSDSVAFNINGDQQETVYEWGRETVFNPEAPLGSDENPVIQTSGMIPPEMPSIDFPISTPGNYSPILVQGDIHASTSGRVLHCRISGPAEARDLLRSFAGRLREHQVAPSYHNGEPVSVLYRFIALVYPAAASAE